MQTVHNSLDSSHSSTHRSGRSDPCDWTHATQPNGLNWYHEWTYLLRMHDFSAAKYVLISVFITVRMPLPFENMIFLHVCVALTTKRLSHHLLAN